MLFPCVAARHQQSFLSFFKIIVCTGGVPSLYASTRDLVAYTTCTLRIPNLLVDYKFSVRRTGCTPRVALYQWRRTRGVQQYAMAKQILYATDEVFPSSELVSLCPP
jgi:hypothetical protein